MTEPCIMKEDIQEIKRAVIGHNGDPGLKTQIALLTQRFDSMPTPSQIRWYSIIGGGGSIFLVVLAALVVKMIP